MADIKFCVHETIKAFGGLDVVIGNAVGCRYFLLARTIMQKYVDSITHMVYSRSSPSYTLFNTWARKQRNKCPTD
jgi:hypothetical protein